jgi:hypothetical protein
MDNSRRFFSYGLIRVVQRNQKETATGDNGKPPKKTFAGKILESVTIEKIAINHVPMYGPDGEKWDSWAIGKEDPDLYAPIEIS